MEEHPVALKLKSASKKQSSSKIDSVSGMSCIIHFPDTLETAITPLKEQSFSKLKGTAAKRLKLSDDKDKLIEISSNIPAEFDSSLHGYHRRCYQRLPKASKRKATSSMCPDDEAPRVKKRVNASPLPHPLHCFHLTGVYFVTRTLCMSKERSILW